MKSTADAELVDAVPLAAQPLSGAGNDHDAILELIGDAHFVLLGEASHGTHEFYRESARITQRLIAEKGFSAVAIEGDSPDAYRVSRFVPGLRTDAFAVDALAGFQRFPIWMWPTPTLSISSTGSVTSTSRSRRTHRPASTASISTA